MCENFGIVFKVYGSVLVMVDGIMVWNVKAQWKTVISWHLSLCAIYDSLSFLNILLSFVNVCHITQTYLVENSHYSKHFVFHKFYPFTFNQSLTAQVGCNRMSDKSKV